MKDCKKKTNLESLYSEALELKAVRRARELLRTTKISDLAYHNEAHTLDVLKECVLFTLHENLSEEEKRTLYIAAAWHDVGFLSGKTDHEESSVRIFEEEWTNNQIGPVSLAEKEIVVQMIRDTKVFILPNGAGSEQKATTKLSQYLLDADLSNLGRADFFDCFERLEEETALPTLDYHIATLGLISRHRWFTPIAENLRLEREMQNARTLVERIKRLLKGDVF